MASYNINGFDFEPEYTDEELKARDQVACTLPLTDSNNGNKLVEEWCQCEHCRAMPVAAECVCCWSSELTAGWLKGLPCITEDRRMQSVVLNEDVLTSMYIQMMLDTGKHGRAPDALDDRYDVQCTAVIIKRKD